MKTKSRITAILEANTLPTEITGFPTFQLSGLNFVPNLNFQFPTNVRLGQMVEKIVAEFIKSSTNFNLLHENIQIIKDKNTIGELDFILENVATKQVIHLELAYKFYLYDPSISEETISNWIGPNRKDSLIEKLDKLKQKQFPLLYHDATKTMLPEIEISKVSQKSCLLASLFVPYSSQIRFQENYQKAIKGYYIGFKTFKSLHHSEKTYYIPSKKEWGIHPSLNENWTAFDSVVTEIRRKLAENHAPLCWQKHGNSYEQFFVVWW
ncbi:DUF1853 family protein [Kordia sp.]|uniref:DUF1853 family protein n=1 Tax=Kordia sp. TaxID=1965332 RepID=UPI003B5BD6FA